MKKKILSMAILSIVLISAMFSTIPIVETQTTANRVTLAGDEKETFVVYQVIDAGPRQLGSGGRFFNQLRNEGLGDRSIVLEGKFEKYPIASQDSDIDRTLQIYPCENITITGPDYPNVPKTFVRLSRQTIEVKTGKILKEEPVELTGSGTIDDPTVLHVGTQEVVVVDKPLGTVLKHLTVDIIIHFAIAEFPILVILVPLLPLTWFAAAIDPGVTVYNGTLSVTTYNQTSMEIIDTRNITGTIYFDTNSVPGALTQEVTIYENGTISEPIEVSYYPLNISFSVYAADSTGLPIGRFGIGESVYVKGLYTLLPNNTSVDIYVIPEESPLDPGYAVTHISQVTDVSGNLPITYLWTPTSIPEAGVYHIWVDANDNGIYENTTDNLNSFAVRAPAPVGGIAELPQIEEPGAVTPDLSDHNYGALAGIIVGAIVGTITLIGAAWYLRRGRRLS